MERARRAGERERRRSERRPARSRHGTDLARRLEASLGCEHGFTLGNVKVKPGHVHSVSAFIHH